MSFMDTSSPYRRTLQSVRDFVEVLLATWAGGCAWTGFGKLDSITHRGCGWVFGLPFGSYCLLLFFSLPVALISNSLLYAPTFGGIL